MTMHGDRSAPAVTPTNPSPPTPTGIWTIVSLAWRKHRLWNITGRLHCFGVIHLDELPPVGVVQFEPASELPVLTLALDPASVQPHHSDLNAILGGPDGTPGLVELHLEVDLEASSPNRLVLQGRGVLDPRGFAIARPMSTPTPHLRLELAVRARRVEDPHRKRRTICTTSMPG